MNDPAWQGFNPVWRDFLVLRRTCDSLVMAAKLDYVLQPDEEDILPLGNAEIVETWESCVRTVQALQKYLQTVQDHRGDEMGRVLRRCLYDVFSDLSLGLSRAILWASYFEDEKEEDEDEWRTLFIQATHDLRGVVFGLRSQKAEIPGINLTPWYENIEEGLDLVESIVASFDDDNFS
jgi:hypothetical protein